jgi:hypothetical protein
MDFGAELLIAPVVLLHTGENLRAFFVTGVRVFIFNNWSKKNEILDLR